MSAVTYRVPGEDLPVVVPIGLIVVGALIAVASAKMLTTVAEPPQIKEVIVEVPRKPDPKPAPDPEPEVKAVAVVKPEEVKECAPVFSILFGEKTEVVGDMAKPLAKIAEWMKEHPDLRIAANGHTDATGDEGFNLRLSHQRGSRVKAMLVKAGIDRGRITVRAFGEYMPMMNEEDTSLKQRRVYLEVPGFEACKEKP